MAQQDDSKRAVDYHTLSDSAIFEILDSLDKSQIKMVLSFLQGYSPEGMAGALENLDERMREARQITMESAKNLRIALDPTGISMAEDMVPDPTKYDTYK